MPGAVSRGGGGGGGARPPPPPPRSGRGEAPPPYLPDRKAVLRYVLAVGPHAASPRFEVLAEAGRVRLADGSDGGRRFDLVEVIDLARPGEIDRLRRELGGPG
jgi:hypothetical protein